MPLEILNFSCKQNLENTEDLQKNFWHFKRPNSLAGYTFRVGLIEDDTCSTSNEEAKSKQHSVCKCPSYGCIKHQITLFRADNIKATCSI